MLRASILLMVLLVAEPQLGYAQSCQASSPPVEETLADIDSTVAVGPPNRKIRYISVRTDDPGKVQAIRVRFESLPPPFGIWDGLEFFVTEPFQLCENSGNGRDVPITDCGPAGSVPRPWLWAAAISCDPTDAHFMDWHGKCEEGTCVGGLKRAVNGVDAASCTIDDDCRDFVHIYNEGIVATRVIPGQPPVATPAVYDIQVVDSMCSLELESSYSPPLTITQNRFGDICGPGPGGVCTGVADGRVDITQDVVGCLDKFANVNALQKARADIEPGDNGINNGPDFKANIARDCFYIVEAVTGLQYRFGPGDPCLPDTGASQSQGVGLSTQPGRPVREGSR